jgi:uncharacterized protein (UPF0332 family)
MDPAHLSLAQWELDAADEELRSFLVNRRAGIHRKALHCLYFAAFHAVRSLLATKGIEATTHRGVHVMLALNLVKPGTVSRASAKTLSELQAVRERADYQVELSYDASDVARHLVTARPLFEELVALLTAVRGLRGARFAAAWREVAAEVGAPKRARRASSPSGKKAAARRVAPGRKPARGARREAPDVNPGTDVRRASAPPRAAGRRR